MKYKIKISDLTLNPENVCDYDPVGYNKIVMDVHMEINDFLDQFGSKDDMGGKYATFLGRLDFDHQSENGWWNHYAVDKKNLIAFLKYTFNCDYRNKVNRVVYIVTQIKQVYKKQVTHKEIISDVLEKEDELRDELLKLKLEALTT